MKSIVLYYETIIKLCNACGTVLKHEHLYRDLLSYSPSPDSYKVLVKNHESDMNVLRRKIEKAVKTRGELGNTVARLSKTLGLYPTDTNFWQDEGANAFCDMLMCRTEDSDFRIKVRDYCKQQLAQIAKGKEPKPMDFGDFVERYSQLVQRRLSKKKKR
ncbi:hypothetical protein IKG13_02030 [Candidatus Saccharibacteria bacterium]|nr:hypothetical protein [Candidatus Saccharibacteria bacterium]